MNVLGMDTSTAATSACLLRADGEAFAVDPSPERLSRPPGHSRELMPALAKVLRDAGLDWSDVDAIAVGVGPGTFTGLRIGVATARSLGRGCDAPLHPVGSLAALAAGIEGELRLPLIDAKRGELFAALHDAAGTELVSPLATRPEALAAELGDRAQAALAAGDGSLRFREVLEAAGMRVAAGDSKFHVVRALHVCRLAASTPPAAPEGVFPNYLRQPDAVPSQ
jgi:tRNA threonylcarbamoyladenosine biosynthesis protein TsaB